MVIDMVLLHVKSLSGLEPGYTIGWKNSSELHRLPA
jgi:hypothetical protein